MLKVARRDVAMDARQYFKPFERGGRWYYAKDDAERREECLRAAKYCEDLNYAFDAAGGSGMGFLASQFEIPEVKLVEPLASVTHARDIPIKTGGGYAEYLSAWAANYKSSGSNEYGIQDNMNLDIPIVQADVQKGIWPVYVWASTQRISYVNLQRLIDSKKFGMPAPYSLQQLLDNSTRLVWNKALDKVVYQGWEGNPGLLNNSAIYNLQAALNSGGTSRTWANKSTTEILNDVNTALLWTLENSGYDLAGMADTCLVDYEHWSILNQPMTIGGFNSLLEYILMNNVAKRQGIDFEILPLPDPWIAGEGYGDTNMAFFYRKSDESVYLKIPQPIQKVFTVPSVQQTAYETLFMGAIGVVQYIRPTTAVYLYDI